jgi:cation diffusion facilitator CzcD-associated flavoprotein CzcO
MTLEEQFDVFWKAYPIRVGKGAARTAFAKAIRKTSLATMLTAIEAYKAHKPAWKDYCHPSTWLNGERWDDEFEPQPYRTGSGMIDALSRVRMQ